MGRGDKKTRKGKIFKGSFGKSRPSKPAGAAKKRHQSLLKKSKFNLRSESFNYP